MFIIFPLSWVLVCLVIWGLVSWVGWILTAPSFKSFLKRLLAPLVSFWGFLLMIPVFIFAAGVFIMIVLPLLLYIAFAPLFLLEKLAGG